jgi:hypothetical protein
MKYWQVMLYTRPTVDLRQGWPVFYSGFPVRNLAITPHTIVYESQSSLQAFPGHGWAGQIRYIFHCHSNDLSSRFLYGRFPTYGVPFRPSVSSKDGYRAPLHIREYTTSGRALYNRISRISLKSFLTLQFRELQAVSQHLSALCHGPHLLASRC